MNRRLDRHIGHAAQRLRELQELERQLKNLRERCGEAREVANCGILDGLSQAIIPSGKTVSHVQGTHRHAANSSLAKSNQGSKFDGISLA